MKRKVGRPIEKENRTKVGLSLDGQYSDMLTHLAKQLGKTKSRIVEEAIAALYENKHTKQEIVEYSSEIIPEVPNAQEKNSSIEVTSAEVLPQTQLLEPQIPPKEEEESLASKNMMHFDAKEMISNSLKRLEEKEKEQNGGSIEKSEEEMRDMARKNTFESLRSMFK